MPTTDAQGRRIPSLEEYLFNIENGAVAAGMGPLTPEEIKKFANSYKQAVAQATPFVHQQGQTGPQDIVNQPQAAPQPQPGALPGAAPGFNRGALPGSGGGFLGGLR